MKYHTSTYTPPHFNLLYSTSIIYEEKNFDLNCHTSTYSPHLYLKYHTSTFTIHSKAIPHLRYTVHEIPHLNRCTTPQSTKPLIHFLESSQRIIIFFRRQRKIIAFTLLDVNHSEDCCLFTGSQWSNYKQYYQIIKTL